MMRFLCSMTCMPSRPGRLGLIIGGVIVLFLGACWQPPSAIVHTDDRLTPVEMPSVSATDSLPRYPTAPPDPTLVAVPGPSITNVPTTPLPPTVPLTLSLPGILYESGGEPYWLAVNDKSQPVGPSVRVPFELPADGRIWKISPSPNGSRVLYHVDIKGPPDSESSPAYYSSVPPNGPVYPSPIDVRPPKLWDWHSNNQQLVYGWFEIALVDVNTGDVSLVVADLDTWIGGAPVGNAELDGLAFSPNGQDLIASLAFGGEIWQVWMANADGSGPHKLFDTHSAVFDIHWSPDGTQIAFAGRGLEVMDSDGKNRRTFSNKPSSGYGFESRWSPDSRFIAYTGAEVSGLDPFVGTNAYIVDIDTGEEWPLVPDKVEGRGEIQPAWSPDSQRVIFISTRSGASEIWMANRDGTQLQQLTTDGKEKLTSPVWLSDGRPEP